MTKKITPQITPRKRIDQWLAEAYPESSRSTWQKQIKSGEVKINGAKVTPHYKLVEGDVVSFHIKKKKTHLTPEAIPLSILFEDENYAILNKPAGLVVHPGSGNNEHTLAHGLLHHFSKELSNVGDENRPGIVHRLDKDTSGLMVIAKTNEAHRNLSAQFEAKTIKKEYLALVHGHLNPKTGTIDSPLNRSERQRQKIAISSRPGSREAITHYTVLELYQSPLEASLLKIKLETGRTHQIRVHLEAIGFPILGDPQYGNRSANQTMDTYGLTRQFLHAHTISFLSPTTKKKVTYQAELPKELEEILNQFTA